MSERATIVLGLGATGRSCIRHLAERERVLVFDTRPAPPGLDALRRDFPAVEVLAPSAWPAALREATRVVASPGIALDHCLLQAARAASVSVTSDIELFLAEAKAPVIGITGTNGKSTVTTLVGRLLAADGRNAGVGGNLGRPALNLLAEERDVYVLELSSFQLERLTRPALAVAAVLNVSADHMDRHTDLDAYAACKRRIYDGAGRAVFNADDPRTTPPGDLGAIGVNGDSDWRLDGDALVLNGRSSPTAEFALQGRHNHFNILAAAAIAHQAGVDVAHRLNALTTFAGLPHRGQRIAAIDSVAYIDDSKATNVGACLAALEGFGNGARNIVLIAGGDAKGASFASLKDAVARHVSQLVLLGRDADLLATALGEETRICRARTMRDAVRLARAAAHSGDIVLLAPACASFDMYANFEERGDAFAAQVRALSGERQGPSQTAEAGP